MDFYFSIKKSAKKTAGKHKRKLGLTLPTLDTVRVAVLRGVAWRAAGPDQTY
jgi:hypothetical protein